MASIEEQVERAVKKAVEEIRSDVDTSQGAALLDLTIKPLVAQLTPVVRSIESMHFRMALRNAPFLSKMDMDDLMSNWFISRNEGDTAAGTIRLYFNEASDIIMEANSVSVLNKNGISFVNTQQFFFEEIEVQGNVENNLFYVDIPVEATIKGKFETLAGEILSIESAPRGAVSVTNKDNFYPGENEENNIDLGLRGEKSITTRNLVNNRSIAAVLRDEFPWAKQVQVVGYGDDEMKRDAINLQEIIKLLNDSKDIDEIVALPSLSSDVLKNFHVGNKTDIYISRKNLITHSVILTASETDYGTVFNDDNAILNLRTLVDGSGKLRFKFPIFDIVAVQQLNSALEPITLFNEIKEETENPTNPNGFTNGFYNFEVLDTSLRFSMQEKIGLRLQSDEDEAGVAIAGKKSLQGVPLKITYRYVDGVEEVQNFASTSEQKLVIADPIVKSLLPGFVDVVDPNDLTTVSTMKVTLFPGKTIAEVEAGVSFFVENIGDNLEISDMIAYLYQQELVSYVEAPLYLKLRIEDETRTVIIPEGSPSNNRFDLKELKQRHVGFISEIVVEEAIV